MFRYDDNGIPRVWKPTDDIDLYFSRAKAESANLLALLSKIDVFISTIDSDITEHEV